ncbi:NACHT domain-containing protein [Candidatus Leptofilum sp.]|uniref:NACHT domain-containing protein n=1 Tax=Candidatus Leptofilum sp. TaxID=3241576 RepID=UPI003B5C8D6D
MEVQQNHNRQVMLQRVKTYWLVGVLQESLHGAEMIDLSMTYRTNAVASYATAGYQQPDNLLPDEVFDTPLPIGTQITEVYDEAEGTLLIMGEPGAGKTTILLQLVSDLLLRAQVNTTHPIPIVFSLASWSDNLPLGDWMVNELANRYEVPRRLGQLWLKNGELLPLLDGLDEVEQEHRVACAQAINQFRQRYLTLPTVVTCRIKDYEALATRLNLAQAIVLQSLSLEQIDHYLGSMGPRLAGLRAALQTDMTLRELAESPLMLSMMTLAYYRMPEQVALSLGDRKMGRTLLFDVYVERMVRYRGGEDLYEPTQTVGWLGWLAQKMSQFNRTIFFLEGLQPNWLPREQQRHFVSGLRNRLVGLFVLIGVLIGLLGLMIADWRALLAGLGVGLLTGSLLAGFRLLLVWARVSWFRIETVETLNWRWLRGLVGGGLGAAGGAVLGSLLWLAGRSWELSPAWILLLALLGFVSQFVAHAVERDETKMRTVPGQGFVRSAQNGRLVGALTGVGTAVMLGLGWLVSNLLNWSLSWQTFLLFALGATLYLGISAGLAYGGLAAWQQRQLSRVLAENQLIPEDFLPFLDYAAERNLLRKVGGGYMFVHLLLLDYFRENGSRQSP